MISLEQVQLLETRVSKTIEYVRRIKAENAALISEKDGLKSKLDANQKRIDELEILVMRFKEDQGRIEDGIIAALDRLSQFEEAFENSLKDNSRGKKPAAKTREKQSQNAPIDEPEPEPDSSEADSSNADLKDVFFEISEEQQKAGEDADSDDASLELSVDITGASDTSMEGELDIF